MTDRLKEIILEVLKADGRLWDDDKKELNQTLLLDLVEKIDENIINLLLNKKEIRDKFFIKIKDAYVFKTNDFRFFVEENKVDNSYTAYERRIGLSDGKRFISNNNLVVLDFPYKDCVLEGGQSTEEGIDSYFEYSDKIGKYEQKQAKRKEIFFNEILAKDEIDRLFDEKAFLNWKRYTVKGGEKVGEIKRDENGTIRENLIIKGNNLLALHSLKKQFSGRIKLIYIDPPYYFHENKDGDAFNYNTNFKLSTWLTFMKNRLKVAYDLLKDDGAIFIQIDDDGLSYLKVLLNELFDISNNIVTIAVKVTSESGVKVNANKPVRVKEMILGYSKSNKWRYNKQFIIDGTYDSNYSYFVENPNDEPNQWKISSIKEKLVQIKNIKYPTNEDLYNFQIEYKNHVFSIRDISQKLKNEYFTEKHKNFILHKGATKNTILWKGGEVVFFSNKVKKVNGQDVSIKYLSDIWTDISWDGIANEGGVKLKKGKKPERLIERIISMAGLGKNDIVLDFFAGTATTCAVAHKMGCQYIGIEQLDYGDNDSVKRLQNVINGDQSGISKAVNWHGGGNFIYFELAKWNETAKEKILETKSLDELEKLFDELYYKYFLNYNLKIKEFKEKIILEKEFKTLPLDEQKKMFLTMLDLNQMYVQKTEMADEKFGIKKEDQDLTLKFYGDD